MKQMWLSQTSAKICLTTFFLRDNWISASFRQEKIGGTEAEHTKGASSLCIRNMGENAWSHQIMLLHQPAHCIHALFLQQESCKGFRSLDKENCMNNQRALVKWQHNIKRKDTINFSATRRTKCNDLNPARMMLIYRISIVPFKRKMKSSHFLQDKAQLVQETNQKIE